MLKGDLILSEVELANVNDTEYDIDHWHIGDRYNDLAINLITDVFYNLYRRHIIHIEEVDNEIRVLGLRIKRPTTYFLKLNKDLVLNGVIGWLEKIIIQLFEKGSSIELNHVIKKALKKVMRSSGYPNPGKMFFKLGLQSQEMHLFSCVIRYPLLSGSYLNVWQNQEQVELLQNISITPWNEDYLNFDIHLLYRKITYRFLSYRVSSD
ncbi:MAG: hypothetical protein EOP52_08595 [Sphingobacteriales bacterium]|nr:MAG: hypothetical protein EOP52_08595 [Sphingobacteriales bacterium]